MERGITVTDLKEARELHGDLGGWLRDLGDGRYFVTDDEPTVERLRGAAWVAETEDMEQWDETLMKAG